MNFILNKSPFIIPLIIAIFYATISYKNNIMTDTNDIMGVAYETATLVGGLFLIGQTIFPDIFKNVVGLEIYMVCGGIGAVTTSINGLIKKFKNIKILQKELQLGQIK